MCAPGSGRTEALIRPEQLRFHRGGQEKACWCSDIKQGNHAGLCSELCLL